MAILSLTEAAELKKLVYEKYSVALHLHDSCGGQYFSLESKSLPAAQFICEYLKSKGLTATFDDDYLSFWL